MGTEGYLPGDLWSCYFLYVGSTLVVVLLVSAAERPEAIVPAMEQGARQTFEVVVREPDGGEDAIAQVASAAHASAVIDVAHPDGRRAVIHLHRANGVLLRQTTTEFAPAQSASDRGRAMGFAIASMIGAEDVESLIGGRELPTAESRMAFGVVVEREAPEPPRDVVRPPPPALPPEEPRFALDASAAAITASSTRPGFSVGASFAATPALELRIGGDARFYQGTSELGGRAGLAWRFVRLSHLSFAARADFLVAHDPSKWTPGMALGSEVELTLFRPLALFGAPSIEVAPRSSGESVWAAVNVGARIRF